MRSIFRTFNRAPTRIGSRSYAQATRSINDLPFDHLPKGNRKTKWINWKTTGFFFILGSTMAYNETLFNLYEKFTSIDETSTANTKLLPRQLEYKLKHLPIYEELSHPKNNNWYRLESWENLDRNVLDNQSKDMGSKGDSLESPSPIKVQHDYHKPSLTNRTLAAPGGVLIKPVIFFNVDTNESVTIVHVGYKLTGYPFLVHGGMIATLLNETFKRNASLTSQTASNLRDDFKVENLTISYKAPTLANQFLIVRTKQEPDSSCDGKTVNLVSTLESQKGTVCVKSTAVLHDTGRASDRIRKENKKESKWRFF